MKWYIVVAAHELLSCDCLHSGMPWIETFRNNFHPPVSMIGESSLVPRQWDFQRSENGSLNSPSQFFLSLLEPALQGWGRHWVLRVSAVYTAATEANNRGNTLLWMRRGEAALERVWALHPTLVYPRGVCAYTTRMLRLSLRPGEAVLATTLSLPVGVCAVQMMKMTTFRVIFMTFRS